MKNTYMNLLPLGLVAAGACQAAVTQKDVEGQRPNVVMIYADDIGFGDLECYGFGTVPTPNVNKVANMGIRFTDAHCSAASSTPSRFAMLTGQYDIRQSGTRVAPGDAAMIIKPDTYTFADMFKAAGYNTAAIGKWHLGLGSERGKQDWNKKITPNLSDIGFDHSYIMAATADRTPCIFIENGLGVNLDPNDPIEVSYKQNFPGEPSGKENPELLKLHPSHGHNQAIVNGISRIGFMKGGEKARWVDEDIADILAEQAVKFIDANKAGEKPFFLYLATNDVHVPRAPHQRFVGKSGLGARGDAILSFDWTVGQVLDALARTGLDKNTIIIISSDNGPVLDDGYKDKAVELLGDHKPSGNLRDGKYSYHEGGTRIPCILAWEGKVQAGVSNTLMSQIDWMASFASMLKVDMPAGAAQDSQNHLGAWFNADTKGREYLLQHGRQGLAITSGEWKYIPGANKKEKKSSKSKKAQVSGSLYNLYKEVGETTNVIEQNPEVAARLKAEMDKIVNK